MRYTSTSWQSDSVTSSGLDAIINRRAGPWGVLSEWMSRKGFRRMAHERTSAELTTQPNAGRGYALREAHRTLARHMQQHPALRQVTPHLAVLERALAKHGSRALLKLPVPVLKRGLEQLAVLQSDEESNENASNLRVLRLRLMETLSLRGAHGGPGEDDEHKHRELLRGAGVEVRHITVDEFNRAVRDARPPAIRASGH